MKKYIQSFESYFNIESDSKWTFEEDKEKVELMGSRLICTCCF